MKKDLKQYISDPAGKNACNTCNKGMASRIYKEIITIITVSRKMR